MRTTAFLAVVTSALLVSTSCGKREMPASRAGAAEARPSPTETVLGPTPAHGVPPTVVPPAAPAAAKAPTSPPAIPAVVSVDPPNGSRDVDPRRTTLSATFDRPMDPQGWAWVVEHPSTSPRLGDATWDAGFRTSTAEVALEPGHDYVVWLNSPQYSYFKDRDGTAARPYRWTFSTRGERSGASEPRALAHAGPPRVVALVPALGATDVDPETTELRATFDRRMGDGWAWVTEGGETAPTVTGKGGFEADGVTAVLPVRLKPGRRYVVWLNSPRHAGFHDAAGVPLPPVRWTFETAAAQPPDR